MKKLLINGLLLLGFVIIIVSVIVGLSRLRAVNNVEIAIDAYDFQEAYATEQAIQQDSGVNVSITNVNKSGIVEPNVVKSDVAKSDVDSFLAGLDDIES